MAGLAAGAGGGREIGEATAAAGVVDAASEVSELMR